MATDAAYAIADAYRGQRRLGNISIAASHCHIVTDPAHPAYGMRTMPTMSRRKPVQRSTLSSERWIAISAIHRGG